MIWNIVNLGETQRERNSYSSNLIIVKMIFQLQRFDSYIVMEIKLKLKPWKEHVFKEI